MTTTAPHRSAAHTETGAAPGTSSRTRLRLLRKIVVAVVGVAVILVGIVMMVLPGPGVVAILAGLGLLGTEFPAARRVSERLQALLRTTWHKLRPPKNKEPKP
ncbi:PGPGW domain-containing protein [Actinomadura sp. HBU206391]|uniref:PGPGW domain-containing protein n=1 Tax=Actinomadura sp. HBU206391 TaxID=2731692 RepID=UPI0016503F1A|nr:PGPGW domain-containing protein [Actinomadura sp. HBU206391]MBC6458896.1 PGPGW domain-containing protein [Actinomadura sp. HBU206391]